MSVTRFCPFLRHCLRSNKPPPSPNNPFGFTPPSSSLQNNTVCVPSWTTSPVYTHCRRTCIQTDSRSSSGRRGTKENEWTSKPPTPPPPTTATASAPADDDGDEDNMNTQCNGSVLLAGRLFTTDWLTKRRRTRKGRPRSTKYERTRPVDSSIRTELSQSRNSNGTVRMCLDSAPLRRLLCRNKVLFITATCDRRNRLCY